MPKISSLPAATDPTGPEQLAVVQSGQTRRMTVSQLSASSGSGKVSVSDLANAGDPSKGAAMVGYDGSTAKAALDQRIISADLANTTDPAKGAALVGYEGTGGTVADALNAVRLADYAALRAYTGSKKDAYITGYLVSAAPSGIAGHFTRDDSDATSADNGGTIIVVTSGPNTGKRFKRTYSGPVFAAWFLVVADASDNTAPLNAALAAAQASKQRTLMLPRGDIKTSTGLAITVRGMRLVGEYGSRGATLDSGTQLSFTGSSGSLIQLGADDGQPWDANLYNGPQGLVIENIDLICSSPNRTTALNNGGGNYAVGCYGIRDWRAGNVTLRNVAIEGFEYNTWGVNSDFNNFYNVTSLYSKYGIYAGPRSDQFSIYDLYTFSCDHAVTVDGASGVKLYTPKIVICGSTTEHPILIRRGSGIVEIEDPWLENFSGVTNQIAFVGAGVEDGYNGNTNYTLSTVITNPFIGTGIGSPGSVKYLVEIGNARDVVVENPVAGGGISLTTNLLYIAAFSAGINHSTSNSSLRFSGLGNWPGKLFTNLGTGTPEVYYDVEYSGGKQFGSTIGRFYFNHPGASAGAEQLMIGTEGGAGQVILQTPTYATGQTNRLILRRHLQDLNVMPSSGTYEQGDFIRNNLPTVQASGGGKYAIFGWLRLVTGSNHVAGTDWAILYVRTELFSSATVVSVPTTGQTVTVAQTTNCQIADPAGALAALTVQFPTPLADGHVFELSITQSITTLTMTPNSGASIKGGITSVSNYSATKWRYNSSNTTWYQVT